jgi:hypothetical protein
MLWVHVGLVILKADLSVTQQCAYQKRTLRKLWLNYF